MARDLDDTAVAGSWCARALQRRNELSSQLDGGTTTNGAMGAMFDGHIFDRICKGHGITHKLTNPSTRGSMVRPNG